MDARSDSALAKRVRTTCPYCGVGCGIIARRTEAGWRVSGDHAHPANRGLVCSKGAALAETIGLEDRLLYPEIGDKRVSWDAAICAVAGAFSDAITEYGPDSVAFYVSGQLLTEDYYVANKLMKGFIGSANIDTNSRLCMASSVAGHKRAFGSDTVPGLYADFEEADLVVLVGSNLAWCHPVLFQRLSAAKAERPDMRVVLVDPRRTATAEIADLHLALKADSDVALFNGLLCHLAEKGVVDHRFVAAHTRGVEAALLEAGQSGLADVARDTGLAADEIAEFYGWVARTKRTLTIYSQGVNQSAVGTDKVNAIINTHLLTGRIGKPGRGPFSVTGQPNAMGGREVGGLSNMLACHMEIANPEHRRIAQDFWNAPTIASRPGLKAVDLFEAIHEGQIKALWVMATNPADSMPDAYRVEEALRQVPFLAVSDVVSDTDTLRHAHVRLPAAGWAEKDGTVTNSERCISRQRSFLPLPGEARPDWRIICDVAARMGWEDAFSFAGPHEIFDEYARMSGVENAGSRDFDISGLAALSEDEYDCLGPVHWPIPADGRQGGRFFADGRFFTEDRKACFIAVRPPKDTKRAPRFPFVLNTGRVRDHWHTMTRTGRAPRLAAHMAEPFAELHPADAETLGIGPADLVEITAPRGQVLVRALITDRQKPGAVFVPFHWTDQTASKGRIDTLVAPLVDPVSGQPALKNNAVAVRRFAAHWFGFAILGAPTSLDCAYWAQSTLKNGVAYELADSRPLKDPTGFASSLLKRAELVGYADTARRHSRFAAIENGRLTGALFLSPEPVAVSRSWATSLLGRSFGSAQEAAAFLAGRPGGARPDPGPTICACFAVGANDITRAVTRGHCTVGSVGETLGAGTNCGSCRAEISRLITSVTDTTAGNRLGKTEEPDHDRHTKAVPETV